MTTVDPVQHYTSDGDNGEAESVSAIRVLIVDDEQLLVDFLTTFLRQASDIDVVAVAKSGEEALSVIRKVTVDVVLLDHYLPGRTGIELLPELLAASPRSRVLVLTGQSSDDHLYEAMRLGASGFIVKDTEPNCLLEAVRMTFRGESYLEPKLLTKFLESFSSRRGAPAFAASPEREHRRRQLENISDREREVLAHIARGQSNREIAKDLVISENTVKAHIANLMRKLNVNSRMQLALIALEAGSTPPVVSPPQGG